MNTLLNWHYDIFYKILLNKCNNKNNVLKQFKEEMYGRGGWGAHRAEEEVAAAAYTPAGAGGQAKGGGKE